MSHRNVTSTRGRGARVPAASCVLVLLAGLLTAATSTPASGTELIPNLGLSAGAKGWTGTGTGVRMARKARPAVGEVRRTVRRGVIHARTAKSSVIPTRGTRVDLTVQIKGMESGGRTTIRLYETRRDGSVVQRRALTPVRTSTSYTTRRIGLTTREAGTRVHARFDRLDASPGQALRFKNASAKATAPRVTTPSNSAPAPAPTSGPTPSPTPASTPTPSPTPSPTPTPISPPVEPPSPPADATYLATAAASPGPQDGTRPRTPKADPRPRPPPRTPRARSR